MDGIALVRDYIGRNHEFAGWEGRIHQVEIMFERRLVAGSVRRTGAHPTLVS